MELHLHLSRAWRALDHKWGAPVDLDSSEPDVTSTTPVLDNATATFSSEEYLRKIKKRPTPYTRGKLEKTGNLKTQSKSCLKLADSTTTLDSGVSTLRIDASLAASNYSLCSRELSRKAKSWGQSHEEPKSETFVQAMKDLVQNLEAPLQDDAFEDSTLDNSLEERRLELEDVFSQLKRAAFSYVKKKYGKRCK